MRATCWAADPPSTACLGVGGSGYGVARVTLHPKRFSMTSSYFISSDTITRASCPVCVRSVIKIEQEKLPLNRRKANFLLDLIKKHFIRPD